MYKAYDIANVFETIAPLQSGLPGDELGFIYGDPHTEVTGVACLWNIHTRSLEACIARNLNMIICHEAMWMPEHTSDWYAGPATGAIYANRARKARLDPHRMVVYRSHSNWDALAGDGVPDQAVASLAIEGLRTLAKQPFFSVQQLPRAMTVAALRDYVQTGLNFPHCRIFGNPEKLVRTFAFLIGGFGENQWNMPQAAWEMGAEVIIMGEMSEFIVIACLEMGMPVIESLHSVSEIPAIKRQATLLAAQFPDLPVHYIPSGAMAFTHEVQENG